MQFFKFEADSTSIQMGIYQLNHFFWTNLDFNIQNSAMCDAIAEIAIWKWLEMLVNDGKSTQYQETRIRRMTLHKEPGLRSPGTIVKASDLRPRHQLSLPMVERVEHFLTTNDVILWHNCPDELHETLFHVGAAAGEGKAR